MCRCRGNRPALPLNFNCRRTALHGTARHGRRHAQPSEPAKAFPPPDSLAPEQVPPPGPAGCMCQVLASNSTITSLNLSDNHIGLPGVKELCRRLQVRHPTPLSCLLSCRRPHTASTTPPSTPHRTPAHRAPAHRTPAPDRARARTRRSPRELARGVLVTCAHALLALAEKLDARGDLTQGEPARRPRCDGAV